MKPRHECAVFGIKADSAVFDKIYLGLYSMQHRGQESAGIATRDDRIKLHRDMGLVSEVFKNVYLEGNSGIGHVRYSTTGESGIENAQPLLINYARGSFAIAHNGNLINSRELRDELEKKGSVFTTTTDTEIIAQLIVQEHLKSEGFMEGLRKAIKQLRGAYCLVILKDEEIIAIRDPWAIHPLVLGKSRDSYVVASESCALDTIGIPVLRDIRPGEILVIGNEVKSYSIGKESISHCVFEYVYFARADSLLNGINVYDVRKNLGRILYREAPVDADIITAVPDSGITTAIGYAEESKIPYGESLMKNRYLGRTFIMPEQKEREQGVKLKLNPIKSEIKGKKIILVDDSIVRGTTIRNLINLLRRAGAKEVHVRISCPPVKHPCFYGIDMQREDEFIAARKSVKEICEEIGADSLAYTSLEGLIKAIGIPKKNLCLACLNGEYPIKEEQTKLKVG